MEDWVRAVNGCRRKLSEQEEDDRNKREGRSVSGAGPTGGMAMAIPPRQAPDNIDTHQGTYSSVFTNSTSISSSPVATTGYFAPKIPSQPQSQSQQQGYAMGGSQSNPHPLNPSSPLDTTNNLTAQMARVSIPQRTPSTSAPQSRSVSSRREPSASSMSSIGRSAAGGTDYQSRSPQPPPVSSDEDEPYFSDPNIGLGMSVGGTPSTPMMSPSGSTGLGMGSLVIDPKKIILSAYLMKRSKGRGKKVWKKRWFFLTSQGLTYTKSHMVCTTSAGVV